MASAEIRYRVVSALLVANCFLNVDEAAEQAGPSAEQAAEALDALVQDGSVVHGELVAGEPGPQYVWSERWQPAVADQTDASRHAARSGRGWLVRRRFARP